MHAKHHLLNRQDYVEFVRLRDLDRGMDPLQAQLHAQASANYVALHWGFPIAVSRLDAAPASPAAREITA